MLLILYFEKASNALGFLKPFKSEHIYHVTIIFFGGGGGGGREGVGERDAHIHKWILF